MLKVIYIAGPYRDNRGEWWVEQNIRRAEQRSLLVWENGGVALCPHKNTALFGGALHPLGEDVWIKGDLELLARCDAIWPEGQEKSGGTRAEIEFAQAHNIPVLNTLWDVLEFLEKRS